MTRSVAFLVSTLLRFEMRFMQFLRRLAFHMLAESGDVQRVFVRGVGFRFGHRLRRTHDLLNIVVVLLVFVLLARSVRSFVFFGQMIFILFVLLDFRRRPIVNGLLLFILVGFIFFKDSSA